MKRGSSENKGYVLLCKLVRRENAIYAALQKIRRGFAPDAASIAKHPTTSISISTYGTRAKRVPPISVPTLRTKNSLKLILQAASEEARDHDDTQYRNAETYRPLLDHYEIPHFLNRQRKGRDRMADF